MVTSRVMVYVSDISTIQQILKCMLQITSFAEAANAVQTGYGFTYSLSLCLSAVGLLTGGDLISGKYSIGGADPRVPNNLGPALGLYKHAVFEIDGSITREDVFFGNNANFILQRWDEYVAIANKYSRDFGAQTQAEDNVWHPGAFFKSALANRNDHRGSVMTILEPQIPSF